MSDMEGVQRKNHRVLAGIGFVLILFALEFTIRIIWEETSLTHQYGPQMVGFSLAHGEWAFLMLSPILLAVWFLIALVVEIVDRVRKIMTDKTLVVVMLSSVLVLGTLSIPETFWQWLFVGYFATSSHAADLMTSEAAEGDVATVRGYLDHGVSIESTNYEGSTAAFTAAAGGSVPVLRLLISRGANVNALNAYGDSPLQAAVENKHDDVAQFLRGHGAKQIAGTPEQRDAASKAIVDRDIKRMSER
jgi:hypothetical protein